jgi:hypothetical protein
MKPVANAQHVGHFSLGKQAVAHSLQNVCPHSLKATASLKTSVQIAQMQLSGGEDVKISTGYPMVILFCDTVMDGVRAYVCSII